MKKKTVLITGGTGFVGTNLIKKCKKKRWNVISLSLNRQNKIKGIKEIKLNVSNRSLLFKKLNKFNIDYVINLAGHINHHEKKKLMIHILRDVKI